MSDTTTPPRRRGLWWKLLLVVSLAINLMIAGIVAGWIFSKGPPSRMPADGDRAARSLGVEPFVRALEPDDRRALLDDYRRESETLRENRRELRDRFERLLTAIAADPYDAEAVRTVMADQRVAAARRQEVGERLLLNRLEAMSADERRAFVDRLREGVRRKPRP